MLKYLASNGLKKPVAIAPIIPQNSLKRDADAAGLSPQSPTICHGDDDTAAASPAAAGDSDSNSKVASKHMRVDALLAITSSGVPSPHATGKMVQPSPAAPPSSACIDSPVN
jgi:hypothetical protein